MDTCLDDALKLDYLNGLLSEKERALFEEHLAACPGCRREIVELRNTVTAVAGLTPPSVPAAWTAAAKDRLRAKRFSPAAAVPSIPATTPRRTNVFQYAVVAAGVTAGLVLLLWLVMGGTVQRWLPGLSTAALGISEPRAARTVDLVIWILSLHALLFVPSIIDNVYRLVRRGGRRSPPGRSAGFFAS
ncbi:MAG: zf-HC2 domain-containing protein [Candidatus Aminicenantes bacterium]|nr:zf-HC2 domain-containing protein [Candidatus Aminicenantes bacterium]